MNRLLCFVGAFPLALFLAACATEPQNRGSKPADAAPGPAPAKAEAAKGEGENPVLKLEKGMSTDKVREQLGDPAEIKPYQFETISAEIWVYRRTYLEGVSQVVAGMRFVEKLDPMHRDERMTVEEPVTRLESVWIEETTEILVLDGVVLEWKQSASKKRSIQ